jgi:MoaA/NifB/PqqE/SkfB family radical SAM enzyme
MAFCRLPWQGLMITPRGDFRLCALTNGKQFNAGMATDENGTLMNIMTHSPNDGLNGEWHRAVRLNDVAKNGAFHDICSCCSEREAATGGDIKHINASRRQSMEHRNPSTNIASPTTYQNSEMDQNGYVKWQPTTLDIRFGNLCNAKCVHCGPGYSNQWYEDSVGFFNSLEIPGIWGHKTIKLERNAHGKVFDPAEVRWWESPVWWEKFEAMLPTLEHIYITGGEPMIVPAHDEMLDRIIANGRAKEIYLDYDTNLSVINDKIAQRWSHFKHVEIAASIDAAYEPYELIRTASWENFKRNVGRVKEYEKDGVVKLHRLSSCTQMSTTHTMFETEDWVHSQGIPFQVKFVDSPTKHAVSSLPRAAKEELVELYSTRNTPVANTIKEWLINHLDPKFEDMKSCRAYIRLMNYLDTSRGTNWRKTIPGTSDLLNKYII